MPSAQTALSTVQVKQGEDNDPTLKERKVLTRLQEDRTDIDALEAKGLQKVNSAASNPLVTSDSAAGYGIGSIWINTTDLGVYICVDATAGAADWNEVSFV